MSVLLSLTLGPTQRLDDRGSLNYDDVRVFDLEDGRIVATWVEPSTDLARFAVYALDGTQLSAAQTVDAASPPAVPGSLGFTQTVYAVTPGTSGGFTLHYSVDDTNLFPLSADHYTVAVDSAGTLGTPVAVAGARPYFQPGNSITKILDSGNVAIASDGGLAVMDSNGAIVGGSTTSPGFSVSDNGYAIAEVASNGNILVVSANNAFSLATFTNTTTVTGQFYTSTGTALGASFAIAGPVTASLLAGFVNNRVSVAELSDGRFAVVFSVIDAGFEPDGDGTGIGVVLLAPDGSIDQSQFLGNPDAQKTAQFAPSVHALGTGGFVVGYETNDTAGGTTSWRLQVFDAAGAAVGASLFTNLSDPDLTVSQFAAIIHPDRTGMIIGEGGDSTVVNLGTSGATVNGGDDDLTGTGGDDSLDGGLGNDTIDGGLGFDTVVGGDGNDSLAGGGGADVVFGGDGNDELYGNSGLDTIFGGASDDYASGGFSTDELHGGDGNDELQGRTGADTLYGDAGDDTLFGSQGKDLLYGGDDDDILYGATAADTLFGGNGDDTLFGSQGRDALNGGAGNDEMSGGSGSDTLNGDAGNDKLRGNTSADTLNGGAGNDSLFGGTGSDTLSGDAGDDLLAGQKGADTLNGGTGNDTLRGGEAVDVFVFDNMSGTDILEDFSVIEGDMLRFDTALTGGLTDGAAIVGAFVDTSGPHVIMDFGGGNQVTLEGVSTTAGLADLIEGF